MSTNFAAFGLGLRKPHYAEFLEHRVAFQRDLRAWLVDETGGAARRFPQKPFWTARSDKTDIGSSEDFS